MSIGTTDQEAVDDPIEYFITDMEFQGKSERTRDAYERVLREFENQLLNDPTSPNSIAQATPRDCMSWIHTVRQEGSESTVATYTSYLHRFFSYMTQVGAFQDNPMAIVVEQIDESIDTNPARREISLDQMRAFVQSIGHPLDRAVIVTLLKTGMRAGELCNLDIRDIHFTNDFIDRDGPLHPHIQEKPDSLLISPDPSRGTEYNGEVRTASNKRRRQTVVPIDPELKRELVRWLLIRPDPRSGAEPLFTSTDRWGKRVTLHMVHHIVERHAREFDWYRTGGGSEENVTPHYFRHFFTTHLRDATGDRGIVKYLRGDVADDIIDTYTHNWGNRVRDVYDDNIYSLFHI